MYTALANINLALCIAAGISASQMTAVFSVPKLRLLWCALNENARGSKLAFLKHVRTFDSHVFTAGEGYRLWSANSGAPMVILLQLIDKVIVGVIINGVYLQMSGTPSGRQAAARQQSSPWARRRRSLCTAVAAMDGRRRRPAVSACRSASCCQRSRCCRLYSAGLHLRPDVLIDISWAARPLWHAAGLRAADAQGAAG